MKIIGGFLMIITLIFLSSSCGSGDNPVAKAKKAMKEVSNVVDAAKTMSKSQIVFQESADRMEELKYITPASKDELKAWLPESLGTFKRKGFSVGEQGFAEISSITGNYVDKDDANKKFDINVIDGAGEAGGIFAMVYTSQFNRDFEEEHQDGFSKSMENGGRKAVVSQNNQYKTAEIEFMEGKRYYIKLTGNQFDVDDLWEVVSKIKTEKLPGLEF